MQSPGYGKDLFVTYRSLGGTPVPSIKVRKIVQMLLMDVNMMMARTILMDSLPQQSCETTAHSFKLLKPRTAKPIPYDD
jgi:hypothetical protein